MPKYRKKPVVVEAIQYWGSLNYKEICDFVGRGLVMEYMYTDQSLLISTLKGELTANKGDFIIKGIQGEFYPLPPDVFEETYDFVEE